MNIYLFLFITLHAIAIVMMLFNVAFLFKRYRQLKKTRFSNESEWFNQLNKRRIMLVRSSWNFGLSVIAEGVSLWLLWMGGVWS